MRLERSVFNLPVAPEFDPARWAEAAFDVWQGSGLSVQEISRAAERRTHALIAYARAASPYYAQRYRKLPADAALTDLPPVTKSDLNGPLR